MKVKGSLILVAGLSALPYAMEREDKSLDGASIQALKQRGHTFARLPEGMLHYELSGPTDGPLVVLVHGVSGPMNVWDQTVEPLRQAGFRVLRYDHFGRGYSERREGDYDLDLYVSTLDHLLAALSINAPVDLVGSSMGAIVSAEFAVQHPERVRKVALIGPAGFPLQASPLAKLARVRCLGEYIMHSFGDRSLAAHNRKYFYEPDRFLAFQREFEAQLRIKGSKRAILSTLRHTPVQSYVDGYRKLGARFKEVMVVWGREDRAFPFAHHRAALEAIPGARFVPIEKAGHLPQYEAAQAVNPPLLQFLLAPAK